MLTVIFLTSVYIVLWLIHATFNVMFYLQIMTNLWKLKYQKSNKNYFWLQDSWYLFLSQFSFSCYLSFASLHLIYTNIKRVLTYFWSMFQFYTPGNTRKPLVFWCFQGVWNENIGQKWVNLARTNFVLTCQDNANFRYWMDLIWQ